MTRVKAWTAGNKTVHRNASPEQDSNNHFVSIFTFFSASFRARSHQRQTSPPIFGSISTLDTRLFFRDVRTRISGTQLQPNPDSTADRTLIKLSSKKPLD